MRTLLVATMLLAATLAVVAPADAGTCVKNTVCVPADCIQVYPWSELCGGNVGGFVAYYLEQLCGGSCFA